MTGIGMRVRSKPTLFLRNFQSGRGLSGRGGILERRCRGPFTSGVLSDLAVTDFVGDDLPADGEGSRGFLADSAEDLDVFVALRGGRGESASTRVSSSSSSSSSLTFSSLQDYSIPTNKLGLGLSLRRPLRLLPELRVLRRREATCCCSSTQSWTSASPLPL